MNITYSQRRCSQAFLALLLYSTFPSCAPKVTSFQASPATVITRDDSIRFTWQVRGKPTLLFYPQDAGDEQNPGKEYLNYRMVAQKGTKWASFPILTLTLLPTTSTDYIIINTQRSRDSAIAEDTRDTLQWGHQFLVDSLSSGSHRPLTIIHAGKTIELGATGNSSASLQGLPNSGPWVIRTLLTPAELKDSALIPARLIVKTIITHHKN